MRALSAYQNLNGGFAHAIEPDYWNPVSSPIQTWCALEILCEAGTDDKASPIIRNVLHYLGSSESFAENKWLNEIESNNNYPHAQWWHFDEKSVKIGGKRTQLL